MASATADLHNIEDDEDRHSEDTSSQRSEGIGSITHPYRSLLTNTSFPRCHLMSTPDGSLDSFVRSIVPLGHGYPLWDPIGDTNRPQAHLREGNKIGDVGLVNREGEFSYYFNIFLPATDPIQYQCPPNFEPLQPPPESSDILVNPSHFPPGTVVVSKGVSVSRLSDSPLDIEFNLKAREGGIIVLPDGATSTDLASTSRLLPYVNKHALDWYRFIHERLPDSPHPNGSLYVITGYDNAKAWGFASGAQHGHRQGEQTLFRYQRSKRQPWYFDGVATARSDIDNDPGMDIATIFIRGMKVAVNPGSWTKYILRNSPPQSVPRFNLLSTPILGLRAKVLTILDRRKEPEELDLPVETEVIFHPLTIICRILLNESPTAAVAIAEDSLWSSVCNDNQSDGTLPEAVRLIAKILENYEVSTNEGLVTLIPKTNHLEGEKNFTFRILGRIGRVFVISRRRKEILTKIDKALPGPDSD